MENLEDIHETIEIEKQKYNETRQKAMKLMPWVQNQEKQGLLDEAKMIELYDSQGISPELIKDYIPTIKIPDTFSAKVAARHEKVVREAQTSKGVQISIPFEIMIASSGRIRSG